MDIDFFLITKRNVYYKTKWKLFFLFSWKNSYDACQLEFSCSLCVLDFKYFFINNFCKIQ